MTTVAQRHVIVTGTPGTGKSTICELVIKKLGSSKFRHVNVGDFCKDNQLLNERDEERDCWVLNEDALVDELEKLLLQDTDTCFLFDYHGCDFFPQEWMAGVFVLSTDNTVLYERLEARGYAESKIQENVQCEIFQEIYLEAMDAYDTDIVFVVKNDDLAQQQEAVDQIVQFMKKLL